MKKFVPFLNKYGFGIAVIGILLAILFESSVFSFPLGLMSLLLLFIFTKSVDVFLIAFITGMFIDILSVRWIGLSSLYFVIILFLTYLYERKYDTQTLTYVFIATSITSYLYSYLTEHTSQFGLSFFMGFLAAMCFLLFKMLQKFTSARTR